MLNFYNITKKVFAIILMVSILTGLLLSHTYLAQAKSDSGFKIIIRKDGEIVKEQILSQPELEKFGTTHQYYTSLDYNEEAPMLILTEGVLLKNLVSKLGLDMNEVKSFNLYKSHDIENNDGAIGHPREFLYSNRYVFPEILAKNAQNNPNSEETNSEETNNEKANNEKANNNNLNGENVANLSKKTVEPILALKSAEFYNGQILDWSKLDYTFGTRICYGQLKSDDSCNTRYGEHYKRLEIVLKDSPKGVNSDKPVVDDHDYEAGGNMLSPSGQTIGNLPTNLTVKVGYFGEEFVEQKTFSIAELRSLPVVEQTYSLKNDQGNITIDAAKGVRLIDVLAAANIDYAAIQNIHFYSADPSQKSALSLSPSFLIETPRYFYPRLTGRGGSGATTSGAVRVDTILAYSDNWQPGASLPDFFNINNGSRFRLLMGQANPSTETASKCWPYINKIEVQMTGERPSGSGNGPISSSGGGGGDGTGFGTGTGSGTGAGSDTSGGGDGKALGAGSGAGYNLKASDNIGDPSKTTGSDGRGYNIGQVTSNTKNLESTDGNEGGSSNKGSGASQNQSTRKVYSIETPNAPQKTVEDASPYALYVGGYTIIMLLLGMWLWYVWRNRYDNFIELNIS